MTTTLSLFFILLFTCPLALARKTIDEPRVLPEPRPDKALAYICQVAPPLQAIGTTPVFVDDALLGAGIGRKACTFDYLAPGTHVIWHWSSRVVTPTAIGFFEWDFEPGQTYYFGMADDAFGALQATFRMLDENTGKALVAAAEELTVEKTKSHMKILNKVLYKSRGGRLSDLGVANNALIASRRFDQGVAKQMSADTAEHEIAVDSYEDAARLFTEAANKFAELEQATRKRRTGAIVGNILGPLLATASARVQATTTGFGVAFYTITSTKSLDELIDAYEHLAAEARTKNSECLRRLACHSSAEDDAALSRCISEIRREGDP